MDPYSERTPSLTNSDSSCSLSSDPSSAPPMHPERDRPLPSLPPSKSYNIPFPIPRETSAHPIESHRSLRKQGRAHERPLRPAPAIIKSIAWQRMQRAAVHSLKRPRVLICLLQYLPWSDLYALISTCADMRRLWDIRELRDIILSHYVPEYRYALRHRDLFKCRDIDLSLQDLDLLRWCSLLFPCRAILTPCEFIINIVSYLPTCSSPPIPRSRTPKHIQPGSRS